MRRVNPIVGLLGNLALEYLGVGGNSSQSREEYQEPEIGESLSIRALRRKTGSVTVLIGSRESGKSVLGYRLAELLGRPVYAVSPEQHPPSGVGELDLEDIAEEPPPRSTLFLDDLPAYMGTRDYGSKFVRVVEKIVPVVRHKRKLHLIFSTQMSSMSDKYVLDADLVILKPPSIMYRDLERASVRRVQDRIAHLWAGKTEHWVHRHCYVLSHREEGLFRVQKASLRSPDENITQ